MTHFPVSSDIDKKDLVLIMKRIFSIFLLTAMLLTSLSFVSCGKKMKIKDGNYYCEQNGVTYQVVEFEYLPVAIGKEYATFKDGNLEYKLYEIQGAAPERWLSTADGNLFCAIGEKIPAIDEMNVNGILVCYEQTNVVALATIRDMTEIESILGDFASGDVVKFPDAEIDQSLRLRLASNDPGYVYG